MTPHKRLSRPSRWVCPSTASASLPNWRYPARDARPALVLRLSRGPSVSANISGQTPPTTAIAAKQQLGKAVTVYLDGGEAEVGKPSTIIDLSGPRPYLLREGALSAEQIGEVIGVSAESLRTRPGSQSS